MWALGSPSLRKAATSVPGGPCLGYSFTAAR